MKSIKKKGIFLRNKKTIVPSGAQKTLECGVRDHEEADCLCPPHNLVITNSLSSSSLSSSLLPSLLQTY